MYISEGIDFCNFIECDFGFYGIKCSDVCSEYCVDFMLCDYVNGSCKIGC